MNKMKQLMILMGENDNVLQIRQKKVDSVQQFAGTLT